MPSKKVGAERNLSVAIVGSGALGSFYGARLWETGIRDVRFLMRGEHLEACRKSGLRVTSVDGDVFIPSNAGCFFSSSEEIGKVDWVIICIKSTAMKVVPSLIKPLLKESTRVLAIMNGLVDEDLVKLLSDRPSKNIDRKLQSSEKANSSSLPCAAIYGGMAFSCANRTAPGKVKHLFGKELAAGVAAKANRRRMFKDDEISLEELWRSTKMKLTFEPSLIRGRWRKNIVNLPFNGVSVAMGGVTVDKICTKPELKQLADNVMNETIVVANADLEAKGEHPSEFFGNAEKEKTWKICNNLGPYKPSTMIDLQECRPMEVKYLFQKPLERAKELRIHVPHLEFVVSRIEEKQRMYKLY